MSKESTTIYVSPDLHCGSPQVSGSKMFKALLDLELEAGRPPVHHIEFQMPDLQNVPFAERPYYRGRKGKVKKGRPKYKFVKLINKCWK